MLSVTENGKPPVQKSMPSLINMLSRLYRSKTKAKQDRPQG